MSRVGQGAFWVIVCFSLFCRTVLANELNVAFWIEIYSKFTSQQGLIHDSKYINHIYEVIDFKKKGSASNRIRAAKSKWRKVLLSVHGKQNAPQSLTRDEKKVVDLFKDIDEPNKYLNAAHRKRLRFQLGQKDAFLSGLIQSGRYLEAMEKIFDREGLPIELTRLPFVESSFNLRARSKVGASGIWQFMRSTAQDYIQVNEAVDERNDPIRATEAAALLLKRNYQSLKDWSLAVTAYNHGRKGMMRAIRSSDSSGLDDLATRYRNRSFGFASGNFFAEFSAAKKVEEDAEKYFGKVAREKAPIFAEVMLPDFVPFRELVHQMDWDRQSVIQLNPALTEQVLTGKLWVPAGYRLRIPCKEPSQIEADLQQFLQNYKKIPPHFKLRAQRSLEYGAF